MSSNEPSENPLVLDRITEDIPTTPEDVAALRRARELALHGFTLEQVHLLAPPAWFPRPPRRRTFEGFEPFEL